jgi:hypothetical protein
VTQRADPREPDPLDDSWSWPALGGDDLYLMGLPAAGQVLDPADPRFAQCVATDLAAASLLDPIDQPPAEVVELFWAREGARLLQRREEVRRVAASHSWAFNELDAPLSQRLVDADITAATPRVTRHVCRPADAVSAWVADLTGVTYHDEGQGPDHLRLRGATLGLVRFPSNGRLAAVPAGAFTSTWRRFGGGQSTESPEFDDVFDLHTHDPTWALTVLNPANMERLLRHAPITLAISHGYLGVILPGLLLPAALPGLAAFATQIAWSAAAARSD